MTDTMTVATHVRLRRAFEALKSHDRAYYDSLFASRTLGTATAAGSGYMANHDPKFLESLVLTSLLDAEPITDDPGISAPAVGFKIPLPGFLGIVDLSTVDPAATVAVVPNPKPGCPDDLVIHRAIGDKVDFTTILLGPEGTGEIVWTFYPGGSIAPQVIETNRGEYTVAEALALGFTYAKVVN